MKHRPTDLIVLRLQLLAKLKIVFQKEFYCLAAWSPRWYIFWLFGFFQFEILSIVEMSSSTTQSENQRWRVLGDSWYDQMYLLSLSVQKCLWFDESCCKNPAILPTSVIVDLYPREDDEGLSSEETLFLRIASAAEGLILAAILSVILPRWKSVERE